MKISNLSKAFGGKVLFSSLSFDFPVGVTFVSGASGSGKTTLLRMIAGFEKPDGGEISGAGKIGYCFQEPRLLPWKTALENAAIAEREAGLAEKILCELGLCADLGLLPAELSGGMQKRVALARALASDFDTLLLDEPFAGLDTEAAENAMNIVHKYADNMCVLLVSHDEETAESARAVLKI